MDQASESPPRLVKYRTAGGAARIEPVEVLRETAAFIYVAKATTGSCANQERRQAKVSTYDRYHDTWGEAHEYLLKRAESAVRTARADLARVDGHLGNIKGMKPPKGCE